jgi:hypothetical protein
VSADSCNVVAHNGESISAWLAPWRTTPSERLQSLTATPRPRPASLNNIEKFLLRSSLQGTWLNKETNLIYSHLPSLGPSFLCLLKSFSIIAGHPCVELAKQHGNVYATAQKYCPKLVTGFGKSSRVFAGSVFQHHSPEIVLFFWSWWKELAGDMCLPTAAPYVGPPVPGADFLPLILHCASRFDSVVAALLGWAFGYMRATTSTTHLRFTGSLDNTQRAHWDHVVASVEAVSAEMVKQLPMCLCPCPSFPALFSPALLPPSFLPALPVSPSVP